MKNWTILVNHLDGKVEPNLTPELSHTLPFRLYDDDNILYFEGLVVPGEEWSLLEWAMINFGCTRLDTKDGGVNKNSWTTCIG